MKLTTALILTATIAFTPSCLAQEEDMCRSLLGWTECYQNVLFTNVCFDKSAAINCLDCVFIMAELGVIDNSHENVVNTIAGCLKNNFSPGTWNELEYREGEFTDSIDITHSAEKTRQFIIDSVYKVRIHANYLMCQDSQQEIPEKFSESIMTWHKDEGRDAAPVTASMAKTALKEQPEAEAVFILSDCSGFHPRYGPPIYFQPTEETELAYSKAMLGILKQSDYSAVAVARNSFEVEILKFAGWKARTHKDGDYFVTLIRPLPVYRIL